MVERVVVATGVAHKYGLSKFDEVFGPVVGGFKDHLSVGGVQQAVLHHDDFRWIDGRIASLDLLHAQDLTVIGRYLVFWNVLRFLK